MAGLGQIDPNVEANQGGGGGGVTVLPDDEYELELYDSDVKANSKGTGQNLDFKVRVASGPYKDKWFFGGITNIQHDSAQAQSIAQGTLKSLALSCGLAWPLESTESDAFHYRPFFGRVGSETYYSKKHGKDMTKNVILKYLYEGMPEEDAAPSPPATKSQPQEQRQTAAPAASAGGGRAWQRKSA